MAKNFNPNNPASQNSQIANYLLEGNTLTSLEALDKFHCFRLASRISDLKKEGYNILVQRVQDATTKKWYARYYMA